MVLCIVMRKENGMNDKDIEIFDGLIAEYELRAKYNDDPRDYETYSMLIKARGILTEERNNE